LFGTILPVMSIPEEEMIERVRHTCEAFNRGDFDSAMEGAHPDMVFTRVGVQSDLKGAEAVRAWMEPDAFESMHLEPVEFRVAGNKVLVRQRTTMRGAGSGIEMENHIWGLWTFDEDGRVTSVETFLQHEEDQAIRALGAE
jgi:ketosteroid isomerase-like protein